MSTWFKRLKEIREQNGLTQPELGSKIGIDATAVSRYEKGKGAKNIPYQLKQKLTNVFSIEEIAYIEIGKNDKSAQKSEPSDIQYDENKMIAAPIMSVKASAGQGNEHYDVVTTGELLIDRMLFKVLPNLKDIRAIEVEGDSMYPTLKDGDYVIIEENSHFSGDGIYVLQWDSVLLVKRLQAGAGKIDIISDNQSYSVNTFNPTDDQRSFHIVGKVILRMQR